MHKPIFAALLCAVITTCCKEKTDQELLDDSGRQKIVSILSDNDFGIDKYNKNNSYLAETKNIFQDLNIPEIVKFFECSTVIGSEYLSQALQNPLNSSGKDVVLRRQSAIKILVDNPGLRNEIGVLIKEAREEEQNVIHLLSDFFKGESCPEIEEVRLIYQKQPWLAPLKEFAMTSKTGRAVGISPYVGVLGSYCYGFYKISHNYSSLKKAFAGMIKGFKEIEKMKKEYCKEVGLEYVEDFSMSKLFAILGSMGVAGGVGLALNVRTLYKDYSSASKKRTLIHALNRFVCISEHIEALCKQFGVYTGFKLSHVKDKKTKNLISSLKSWRYNQKKSWFFSAPHVHSFLYELYKQEKHLAEIFLPIAEMDAYYSIATKMIESKTKHNKLCFVKFLDDSSPRISMKGFWNLLVKDPVLNSIDEARHVIFTGPNAGGKTTSIRSIMQLILGQVFGIGAADECEFTMFDIIHSYLNISDDLINGLSLFKSEVKRAQGITEKIKAKAAHQKFFFALDELFTGTNADDGEVCSHDFIKAIADKENIQFVYATHFNKLKTLGDVHDRCANYKVDAPIKNDEGKLVYPFTISEGASYCYVGLDMAKEANLFA